MKRTFAIPVILFFLSTALSVVLAKQKSEDVSSLVPVARSCGLNEECADYCRDITRLKERYELWKRTGLKPMAAFRQTEFVLNTLDEGLTSPKCMRKGVCAAY